MSNNLIINTEEFIMEIQSHSMIWDFREETYCDSNAKSEAWEAVCKKFVKGFNKKSEPEKNAYRTELRKKWKNVRDCYTRELNKQKSEKHRPGRKKYMHSDLLSFLNPVCVVTQNKPSPFPESSEDSLDNSHKVIGVQLQTNTKYKPSKKIKLVEEPTTNTTEAPTTSSTEEPGKSKTEDSGALLREFSGTIRYLSKLQQESDDPDRQFLMSLLQDFKDIPQTSKIDAKYEIMSVIHKYSRLQDFPQYHSAFESPANDEYSDVEKFSPNQSPTPSKCDPLD